MDISGRHIAIDSRILQEDGDEILLEDGTTDSPTSSQIGYILSDEGNIDLDGDNAAHDLVVTAKVQKEVASVSNNVITFKRPIDYEDVTNTEHPNSQGFGLYKHRVDQRVLAA